MKLFSIFIGSCVSILFAIAKAFLSVSNSLNSAQTQVVATITGASGIGAALIALIIKTIFKKIR